MSSIWSYSPTADLQDLEYHWEGNGNLHSRKRYLDRTVPLFLEEVFTYDNLDRLMDITSQNQMTQHFDYDGLGNITAKPPLSNMNYTAPGSGPYGLVSANFTGNVIPETPQDITYTLFDKVETISEGSLSLSMAYGIDHGRIRQIIRRDGMEEARKVYLSGGCEKVTDADNSRYLTYVGGAQGICAILVTGPSGEVSNFLVLKDHLGSLNCFTDAEGNLLEELSFDAWGQRRNPETWTYDNVPSSFLFDRGYTGHEHLDAFGLINMNGRMYDPLSGRFLSTDAYVQAPEFTQSHNRYSYCLNNPLKYTDPDGEFWHIVIGAAVGGILNLAVNWGNLDNVLEGVSVFCVGAAGGAVTASTCGTDGGQGLLWAMAAGAAISATNNIVQQTNNQVGINDINWGQVGISAGVGTLSGAAGYGVGNWASSNIGNAIVNGTNIISPVVSGMVKGAIGGAAGGYAGGFTAGFLISGGDLQAGIDAGWAGLKTGVAIGGAGGAANGYLGSA